MKFTKEEGLDHAHLEQEGPGTTTFICQPCGAPVSSSSVCSLQPGLWAPCGHFPPRVTAGQCVAAPSAGSGAGKAHMTAVPKFSKYDVQTMAKKGNSALIHHCSCSWEWLEEIL